MTSDMRPRNLVMYHSGPINCEGFMNRESTIGIDWELEPKGWESYRNRKEQEPKIDHSFIIQYSLTIM